MRQGGEDGFTVLELVVCLGLLAIITSFIAEGLALIERGRGGMARAEEQDAARAVRMHLRRAIERAVPVFAAGDEGAATLVFAGEPDRLRLVTRSDRRLEGGGLVIAEFRVDAIGGETALVTVRRSFGSGDRAGEEASPRLLLPGVTALDLRYFGPPEPQAQPNWAAEWLNPNALPQLIEVSLVFAIRPQPDWPAMIIALPASYHSAP